MIFNMFDRVRVINLRSRRDRRSQMNEELRKVGLLGDSRVAFFDAIRPEAPGRFSSVGARGVYASHMEILKDAARAGQSVLILEDDCDFVRDAERYIPPAPWDVFYGGYVAADPEHLTSSDIIGAHMMGFTAEGARYVVDFLETLACEGTHPPIDGAYVWFRRAHPDIPTLFAEPPLAHQRPSRTDIADLRFFDRMIGLREAASAARRVKRFFRSRY
jgi:glycosyl transferase family 25